MISKKKVTGVGGSFQIERMAKKIGARRHLHSKHKVA
jgi:hypothetical protein